jgi:hypothetical protein
MKKNERFDMVRKIRLELSGVKINESKETLQDDGLEGSCWEGYEPIGMKELDGRMVPNCVPVEAKKVKEGFPIPSPEGGEDETTFISRCMKEIGGEYDQDQALGICYAKLRGE